MLNNKISIYAPSLIIHMGIILYTNPVLAEPAATNAIGQIYRMDLFSLINFGLSIAALFVTCFMGLLSWLFYRESKRDSDNTQNAVVRIELLAKNIETNMMDIIRRIIASIADNNNRPTGIDILENKIAELNGRFDSELSGKLGSAGGLREEIINLISELKSQTDNLKKAEEHIKIKSLESVLDKIDQDRILQDIFDPNKYARISEEINKRQSAKTR